MCLLLAIFLLLGPRAVIFFWWLAEPQRWAPTFQSAFIPVLGMLFLPWTTTCSTCSSIPGGIDGFDWLWLGLGLIVDIASYSSSACGNRDKDSYPAGPYALGAGRAAP